MKKIGYILISLLALWLCFLYGRRSAEREPMEIVTTDTTIIVQIDTMVVYKPQPYRVEVRDTIYLQNPQNPQGDVFVQEVKEYQDTTYYARISGINAHLEEIRVYPKTEYKYITRTEYLKQKPKKWNIYAFTELGISNVPDFNAGLGLSYTHNRWTIGAEAGKEIIRSNNFVRIKGSFAFARF